jgi:hypothetical protein
MNEQASAGCGATPMTVGKATSVMRASGGASARTGRSRMRRPGQHPGYGAELMADVERAGAGAYSVRRASDGTLEDQDYVFSKLDLRLLVVL